MSKGGSTYQEQDKWSKEERQPQVHVKSVTKYILMRIEEPTTCDGCPKALTNNLPRVRTHLSTIRLPLIFVSSIPPPPISISHGYFSLSTWYRITEVKLKGPSANNEKYSNKPQICLFVPPVRYDLPITGVYHSNYQTK